MQKIAVLAAVLLVAATAMQVLVRNSSAYDLAIREYQLRGPDGLTRDVGYCYLCSSGIGYGDGFWHYRFTLIDRHGGEMIRAHVRVSTTGSRTVSFN